MVKYLFGLTSQDLESRKKVKHKHGVVKGSLIWELSCIFLKEKKNLTGLVQSPLFFGQALLTAQQSLGATKMQKFESNKRFLVLCICLMFLF